jgi:RNA polymerase sigma factor (sigma-70 family)
VGDAGAVTSEAVASTFRGEWGRCLATVARLTGDLDVAEDAVSEAFASALRAWPTSGVPRNPGAWITTTARNRALDRLRREARRGDREQAGLRELERAAPQEGADLEPVADDQLRLVFTCCHPALARDAQVALTLRLLCGLSTAEVARAFLVSESTMAARITRAKKKITQARIPYRVPAREELPDRVASVCEVVHLLFTTGHAAPTGAELIRRDLVGRGRARSLILIIRGRPRREG